MPVLYQMASGIYHPAIVAGNISGTTCDLCICTHGDDWEDGGDPSFTIRTYYQKAEGTSVGTWQVNPAGLGPQGIQGPAGEGFGTITINTPSRILGTAFQLSTTRPSFVTYSARIVSNLTVLGGQAGRIELLSDASNPPTTVRQRVAGGCVGTAVVGVALTDTVEAPMSYLVKPGDYVLLQGVNETGTPTFSLPAQTELIL
jgi:hypothetical protein